MTTDELFIEGVALGTQRALEGEKCGHLIAEKTGAALARALRDELLTTDAAAKVLKVNEKTLRLRHLDWGLTKSLILGPKEPRYFLSQILERAAEKTINGRRPDSRTLHKLAA